MQAEAREVLGLWVTKAAVLRDRNFVKLVSETGPSLTLSLTEDGVHVETTAPGDEAVDALLFTLRLFLQDNDRLSLRNLATKVAADPGLSQEWRDWLNEYRTDLNHHLDGPSGLVLGDKQLTNREILNTFLYGDRGHTNREKGQQLQRWKAMGPQWFALLEHWFKMILVDLLNVVFKIAYLNQVELEGSRLPSLPKA